MDAAHSSLCRTAEARDIVHSAARPQGFLDYRSALAGDAAEMRARGWEVEENISEKHLLAYEYQEQMAIKDHLFGQRILPRIGD